MTIAWAFPGQGSQKLGMADEVFSLNGAVERFELASEILKRDLLAICKGDVDRDNPLEDFERYKKYSTSTFCN